MCLHRQEVPCADGVLQLHRTLLNPLFPAHLENHATQLGDVIKTVLRKQSCAPRGGQTCGLTTRWMMHSLTPPRHVAPHAAIMAVWCKCNPSQGSIQFFDSNNKKIRWHQLKKHLPQVLCPTRSGSKDSPNVQPHFRALVPQ